MAWTFGGAVKKGKFLAREICMAGLKEVPLVGKAVELVESVGARREFVAMGDKVRDLEGSMTGMERRVRDAARLEIESVLAGFRSAGLDGSAREKHLRNFRDIQKHGWSPALFEGLLQNSPEWNNLCRNPQDYGQVLGDQDSLNPDWVHVFIDADKTRILQMPAQMFGTVLAGQRVGPDAPPKVVCSRDVWAFAPAAEAVVAPPAPRGEAPAQVVRPARVISVPPPPPPRRAASLADVLKQRQAHEEAERQEARRREQEAQAAGQRKLDAEYAALRDTLAEQVSAGQYAEAAKTLLRVESLRPPDAELREVRTFLRQRVPQAFPRRTFTNSVGIKFVEIFPGRFVMGSPENEPEREGYQKADETYHTVTLTQGFWLGVYQVTQAQWKAVMGNNPCYFKGESLPVEQVSWEDCQAFCQKISQNDDRKYRLPTEAQWEYACRAGTATRFSFGQTISTDQANYNGNHVYGNGRKGEYRQKTTPVGSFPANAWGLHDMHGNVWEWCEDTYGPYPAGPQADPLGKTSASSRVLRGGSWLDDPRYCRSAYRYGRAPGDHNDRIGCRLACFPLD